MGGLSDAFWNRKPIIGMVHLAPLPGSPRHSGEPMSSVREQAEFDADAIIEGGADAIMVENFFDSPFAKGRVPAHTIAAMSVIVNDLRAKARVPVGVNVLRNDVISAIAIAHVCGAAFVRVNVFVGAAVTDQGIIEGAAREAVGYRKSIGANVAIWADIQVKHAAQLGEVPLEEAARDAVYRGMADALIISGAATGSPTAVDDLKRVRLAIPEARLLVGSGFNCDTAASLLQYADGAIVGTSLKVGGEVGARVDATRVAELSAARKSWGRGTASL